VRERWRGTEIKREKTEKKTGIHTQKGRQRKTEKKRDRGRER